LSVDLQGGRQQKRCTDCAALESILKDFLPKSNPFQRGQFRVYNLPSAALDLSIAHSEYLKKKRLDTKTASESLAYD
jgi:hypothetical protein